MPVYLIVCTCSFCISPEFLLRQHRTRLHEYKSILMVAIFGCFTMKSVLWPNAPLIGGWAVLFTPWKYIFCICSACCTITCISSPWTVHNISWWLCGCSVVGTTLKQSFATDLIENETSGFWLLSNKIFKNSTNTFCILKYVFSCGEKHCPPPNYWVIGPQHRFHCKTTKNGDH